MEDWTGTWPHSLHWKGPTYFYIFPFPDIDHPYSWTRGSRELRGWFVSSRDWPVHVWCQALSLLRLVAVTTGNIDYPANPTTGTQLWTASEGDPSSLLECQKRVVLACKVDELRPEQLLTVKLDLSAIITEGATLLCRLNPSERVSSNSLWSPASGRDAWSDSLPNSYHFFSFFFFFQSLTIFRSKLKTLQDGVRSTNWSWKRIPLETMFWVLNKLYRDEWE